MSTADDILRKVIAASREGGYLSELNQGDGDIVIDVTITLTADELALLRALSLDGSQADG